MIGLVDEAQAAGARLEKACELLGFGSRTIQRWRALPEGGEDRRWGPKTDPPNKLSTSERREILDLLSSPQFRDLPPCQVVPRLADQGRYLASESTMYRVLREEQQLAHRERSKPRVARRPSQYRATGPNQVWSWDITYLPGPVRGTFFYLYLFVDVWSRKIVGAQVFDRECTDRAAQLFRSLCSELELDPDGLVLHSDNGTPMKGATMKATLEALGVIASFSRPRVHDDNPFSEALFRTLKYRPEYPDRPFESLEQASAWVDSFVDWYNHEHLHSAIRFVTPAHRHSGEELSILARREEVYRRAQRRHHRRFAANTRNWNPVGDVFLNPSPREGSSGLVNVAA